MVSVEWHNKQITYLPVTYINNNQLKILNLETLCNTSNRKHLICRFY